MRRIMNLLPSLCALLVGAASFAVSYNTLRLEAIKVEAIEPGWPSYLLPLMLDGAVLSGSAVLWKAGLDGRKRPVFPYFFVAALVILSVVVNVAHAGPSLLAKALASLAPIVLLGCLELVLISHRSSLKDPVAEPAPQATVDSATTPALTQTTTEPAVSAEPAAAAAAQVPAPVPAPAVTEPARPVVEPAAAPAAAATPTVSVDPPVAPVHAEQPAAAPVEVARPVEPAPAPVPAARETDTRRPLRVSAAPPTETTGEAAASDVPAADRVRVLFEAHVLAGGDPADPKLASDIAAQLSVSAAYVRKVIKPLREKVLAGGLETAPQGAAAGAPAGEPQRVLEPSLS